jgi:glutamine amidotransferase|tara:strand:- start:245 stop:880 length:636 start_codon:yes stop_codon:yes gene_type:complete
MVDVVIIDYGMGNIHSVYKSVLKVIDKKSTVRVSNSLIDIKNCTHVVFPGQGAASECMANIAKQLNIDELKSVISQKPFLGICMGLQVLMSNSEENQGTNCLDIIEGTVLSLKSKLDESFKIPHMGWNKVNQSMNHPLWNNIPNNSFFYFVHSYAVVPTDTNNIMSTTEYGIKFTSAISKDNLVAVQFHPEKSSAPGLKLLENFIGWDGNV